MFAMGLTINVMLIAAQQSKKRTRFFERYSEALRQDFRHLQEHEALQTLNLEHKIKSIVLMIPQRYLYLALIEQHLHHRTCEG